MSTSSVVKAAVVALGLVLVYGRWDALRRLLHNYLQRRETLKTLPWLKESHGGLVAAHVLKAHGVKTLFTLTGGHIAPILTGSEELGITVIDVRHEATAAFAADAVSRTTGTVGVCAVTAGPGLSNVITAVKNAQLAQSPLLILGGATSDLLKGRGSLQDIDQFALMGPHVKWMAHISRVADIAPIMEEAFYRAREGVPGPVFVEFPLDTLYCKSSIEEQYEREKPKGPGLFNSVARWYISRHVTNIFKNSSRIRLHKPLPVPVQLAARWQVAQVAKLLSQSRKPVLLLGAQTVMDPAATARLVAAVEAIGAPVWLSSCARGLLGAQHALQYRHCRGEALKASDCIVLAGVSMDFRLGYGMSIPRKTTLISLNLDKVDLYKNRTPTLPILCDPAAGLTQVGDALVALGTAQGPDRLREWHNEVRVREQRRDEEINVMGAAPPSEQNFLNPVHLCKALESAMSPDAVVVADGGDIVGTFAYNAWPRGPRKWLDPGPYGTLGVGGGFALGASTAFPKTELWLIWGDGACGFSLAEFDSFVRHKIPVIAVVGNDAAWQQIVRDQVRFLGRSTAGLLTYQDYHLVAKGFGAEGILIRTAVELPAKLAEAKRLFAEGKAVLVNCLIARSSFREGSISM